MSFSKCFRLSRRAAFFFALAVAGIWIVSCSSDPPNTLGSDSDLLGSEPGDVFQDTIGVYADTTYAFDTPIAVQPGLEMGRRDGYTRTVILTPGFAELTTTDAQRVVVSASLRMVPGQLGSFPMRIHRLGYRYAEGDTVASLDSLAAAPAVPDPSAGNTIDRTVEANDALHALPPLLVQDWIRDADTRVSLAMIYTDTVNERVETFPSTEAADDLPTLQVNYTGGIQRSYKIRDDATAYHLAGAASSNLIVSDGYPRRVFLRAELDSLADDAAVHSARMRFHIVPGTLFAGAPPDTSLDQIDRVTLLLYIPDSTDPASAEFKSGQRIDEVEITSEDDVLEFAMPNAIFLVLQGTLKNNGFAIRCKDENTELRQVELYGSDAPAGLRPQVFVTTSSPAVFN
jgi:hypothetical protein